MIFPVDYDIRKHKVWEINLTGVCNFKCNNCICQVPQFPTKQEVSVQAVEKFVSFIETFDAPVNVHVSGGEPALHTKLADILTILTDSDYVPGIALYSNGTCRTQYDKAFSAVKNFHKVKFAYDLNKDSKESEFFPGNIAPIDLGIYDENNYGCNNPYQSGISLYIDDKYYLCCTAGAIDRVFELGLGIEDPNDITPEALNAQCKEYSKYCSMSMMPQRRTSVSKTDVTLRTNEQTYSLTWQKKKDEFDARNK